MLIPRDAEPLLRRLAGEYPVVAITGPRQSGKTTLARQVFAERPYRNLERPDLRQFAEEDPRGFLADLPDGALIDEVQRVPALLSWLQDTVDADPRTGRFLLTVSQPFGLRQGLSQSLAGRVALLELLPFSACELARGVVIHGGSEPQRRSDLTVFPWRHLARADTWEEVLRPA